MISSLIITTYRRPDYLRGALGSVARSRRIQPGTMEVIVVDNHSKDDTEDVVKEFAATYPDLCIRYTLETRQGVSFARNRGLIEARGKWVAYMDDDQEIDPDYVRLLPEAFAETGAHCIGGKILYKNADKIPEWLRSLICYIGQLDFGEKPLPLDGRTKFLKEGNIAFERRVLEAIGGFDTRLGRTGTNLMAAEGDELQKRMIGLGYKVAYHPSLKQLNWLLPEKLHKHYWRRHAYWHGRTAYRLSETGWRAANRWGGIPRSLYLALLNGIARYASSVLTLNFARAFHRELEVLQTIGTMVEARHKSLSFKR